MSVARASRALGVSPEVAFDTWVDLTRWPAFVEGFARVEQVDETWPAPGSSVVWQSVSGGRGQVSERVVACEPPVRFETEVAEERLEGLQTLLFGEDATVMISLAYALPGGGPLRRLTDILFIRRALAESLDRTLGRFAAEASPEAGL